MLISRQRLAATLVFALTASLAVTGAMPVDELAKRQLVVQPSFPATLTQYDFPGQTRCGQTLNENSLNFVYLIGVNENKFGTTVCGHNLTIVFDNGKSASARIVDFCTNCDVRATPALYELGLGSRADPGYQNVTYYKT